MDITVKYFGMAAEISGKSQETITSAAINLKEAKSDLLLKYPNLESITFQLALNMAIVEDSSTLKNNDELALLPPFAGG